MANEQTQTDAWKAALASRRTQVADSEAVPAAMVSPLDRDVSRRNFIRASFFGGLGLTLLGSVGMLLDYLYPRNVKGFGGPVPAGNVADYVKGADPVPNSEGQFWIANLDPAEDRPGRSVHCPVPKGKRRIPPPRWFRHHRYRWLRTTLTVDRCSGLPLRHCPKTRKA